MRQKLTQEEFISRCKNVLPDLDYSKTQYTNCRTKVTATCPVHGDFTIGPRTLLKGSGCKKCNVRWNAYVKRQRTTTDEFVRKAKLKHNDFYTYSRCNYINSRSTVIITCPLHGDFEQGAGGHLEGYGCPKCGDLKHGDYRPWFISTYFDRFPEKKNIPATLYLLYCKEENFYKVGITTKQDIHERIKYMSHYSFEIVDTVSDSMYNVAIAEQEILKHSTKYKPKNRFGGYSECLTEYVDIHKYIPNKVGNLIQEGKADDDIPSN